VIKFEEASMGRDKEYPLTIDTALNAAKILAAANYVRGVYGHSLLCSSGYRPGRFNQAAGGAENSDHLRFQALDLQNIDLPRVKRIIHGEEFTITHFANWCLDNLQILEDCGLYMEDPRWTPTWVHLTTQKKSQTVFIPYKTNKAPIHK
jgi:hypothetical protein